MPSKRGGCCIGEFYQMDPWHLLPDRRSSVSRPLQVAMSEWQCRNAIFLLMERSAKYREKNAGNRWMAGLWTRKFWCAGRQRSPCNLRQFGFERCMAVRGTGPSPFEFRLSAAQSILPLVQLVSSCHPQPTPIAVSHVTFASRAPDGTSSP